MTKKKAVKKPTKKITPKYTGEYFTDVTIETIEKLRGGKIKPIEANAIAKQASYVLNRAKIQLEILKFAGGRDKQAAKKLLS